MLPIKPTVTQGLDLFSGIPNDVLHQIFSRLCLKDIFACFCTCRQLCAQTPAADSAFWKETFKRCVKPYYLQEVRPGQTFVQGCKEGCRIQQNFIKGAYAVSAFEEGLTDDASLLALSNGKLVSCSMDCSVKIWDLKTQTCEHNLATGPDRPANGNWPFSIKIIDEHLCVGDEQSNVHIWNLETAKTICSINIAERCAVMVAGSKEHVYGIADMEVIILDVMTGTRLDSFQLTHTLEDALDTHKSAAYSDDRLYLGLENGSIHIYDTKIGKHLSVIEADEECSIECLCVVDENLLCSGDDEGVIKIYDLQTEKPLHIFKKHKNSINSLNFYDRKLFSSSDDGMINIWDIEKGTYLKTLTTDRFTKCCMDQGKLYITAGRKIQVLDFTIL